MGGGFDMRMWAVTKGRDAKARRSEFNKTDRCILEKDRMERGRKKMD